MVPPLNGEVVRACDEDSGGIAVFGRISKVFVSSGRCARRVAGAHRWGVKSRSGAGLSRFQSARH